MYLRRSAGIFWLKGLENFSIFYGIEHIEKFELNYDRKFPFKISFFWWKLMRDTLGDGGGINLWGFFLEVALKFSDKLSGDVCLEAY